MRALWWEGPIPCFSLLDDFHHEDAIRKDPYRPNRQNLTMRKASLILTMTITKELDLARLISDLIVRWRMACLNA